MAVELLEQVPELDAILVPVSGGGMLAGICVAAKAIKPNIKSKLIIIIEDFRSICHVCWTEDLLSL